MHTLLIVLLVLLVVLGFKMPVVWLLAAAIGYLLVRRRDRGSITTGPSSDGRGTGRGPTTYHEYSNRRARRERWERRYRRRHPRSPRNTD